MGSSQSKIQGNIESPPDTKLVKNSGLCQIDDGSTETLSQVLDPPGPETAKPNRFTVKAILKPKTAEDNIGGTLNFPQSSSSKPVFGLFQLDNEFEESRHNNNSCWACYNRPNSSDSFESYTPSSESSTDQNQLGKATTRMSSASLASRRSALSTEQPPIYRSANGEFYIAFDSSRFVLSNEFTCPIYMDGNCFSSSEQCYLYQKALFHKHKQVAEQILNENDVLSLHKLTKPLSTMNHDRWNKVKVGVMRKICMAKFNQNPSIRTELFRTGTAILVAAIPDCKWGVGLGVEDPDVADMNSWRGSNILGQVLMAVRALLVSQYQEEFQNEQSIAERRQQRYAKRCP